MFHQNIGMDAKINKCCPNCCQFYSLKSLSQPNGNFPLFIACGHSMCEKCVTNILKCEEPIECKVCHKDMTVSENDLALLRQGKIKLYQLFPVNTLLLGEITLQTTELHSENPKNQDEDCFIDLQAIINSTDKIESQCQECRQPTTQMCLQCNTTLCEHCFNKTHKNFIIFKNHVLSNIDATVQPNNCKIHEGKPLDYYCKDCNKSICMDCLMVGGEKSCKNHNVVSVAEVNNGFLEELNDVAPNVDDTFKRLTKTAVEIGHLLHNVENETGSASELTHTLANIEQNFSKLIAALLKHKKEVTDTVLKLKCMEKESLCKAKADIAAGIKKARTVMNSINAAADPKKAKQANLAVILGEAKQVAAMPWYLTKDESNDDLKVTVNEELCSLVSDYIHLEGNASCVYKIRSTAELGPDVVIPPAPPAAVFPPVLPKDVRQADFKSKNTPTFFKNAPKYRSKSGSVSSLNSDSDNFNNGITMYGDGFQRPMVQQVQPFPESRPLKKLQEGSQELIYITHIVNPHDFFVQRSSHQTTVKELIREFRNAATLPKPSINHVAEGKVYLVMNKADNMWQRCRVVSINRKNPQKPTYLVFCVDFGSTETVTVDNLRLLPPARLQAPYPLAINCSLANCEPKTGAWTSDDSFFLQEIIDNKQAVIHVRGVRSTMACSVTLEVDVVTLEGGVSIAHAFVFHERARMPKPKLPYPKIMGIPDKPKLIINNMDSKPRSEEEVYITHIVSPDKFFVRKRHLQSIFEKLCEDLEQEYSTSGNSGRVFLPELGMACAVHAEKLRGTLSGGSWARAVVQELPGKGRVKLLLPDCGSLLLVHWPALRHLHLKFTTMRALSTECQLAGVTPLNKKWSPGSVALLQRFEERLLTMHVDDVRKGCLGVTLYDHSDPDNVVCVNTEMIKHRFAVTFGIYNFNKNPVVEDQVYTNKSPFDKPKRKRSPAAVVIQTRSAATNINESELDAKDKGPLRLEAKILHYQSPSLFYVSLVHQQKAFKELFEEIQRLYVASEATKAGKTDWMVGDRCCTLCAQSQTWRRGVVLEILPDNTAKVFYTDFACVETVPIGNLRELTAEFTTIGDAAIKCHVCGILPADGSEEWPAITKEYLKELLDAYQRVFITKLGNFKNKSMPVEIWVYHTIQGGALEPNVSEWRCLNRKIVEQGLGVPDKAHQASDDSNNKEDDMLSFLKNVTGSIDEWLQLEPVPTKPLVKPEPLTSPAEEADNANLMDQAEACSSSTVFISDWLPPIPLVNKEFTAMPTYIDNDGVIFLHDVAQKDTLELIGKALDVRFKAPDPKAKYAKWTVGEPCIALFFLDNRYYRGRVVEVNQEDSTCLIHYIDFGNEELCSFENLRKSIALYQVPIQAHRCALARIRPVATKWDRSTLDYIHKSIVEKECFVKVQGSPIEGILPVDIKFDMLCINDHLVEFEMAVYTDGSKPVIRKFAPTKPKRNIDEPVVVVSDSEPDYIVEMNDSLNTIDFDAIKNQDWNKLMEEDNEGLGKLVFYPPNELDLFLCTINVINNTKILELTLIHDDETNVLYEEMFAKLQTVAMDMPPLDGVFENKACLALYHEDNQWYRANIMQYDVPESRVKLRYVDYGNVEVVSLADIREICKEYTKLPPATVSAKLYGVEVNTEVDIRTLMEQYKQTFLDNKGPFQAHVIEYDGALPCVELTNDDDELVYEDLIAKGVFIKSESERD